MTFEEKLIAYRDRFDDQFPRMALMGRNEGELEAMIDNALVTGVPVDPYKDTDPYAKF